jgi:hypothetical protein
MAAICDPTFSVRRNLTMTTTKDKDSQAFQTKCRALESVIGLERASQIWKAHAVLDEEGREELEEQIRLLTNTRLNMDVQDTTPVFFPPTAADSSGDIPVGSVFYNQKELHPFKIRYTELMGHVGYFGQTGSGKTNNAHLLAIGLHRRGIPLWICDFKRTWRELRALPDFQDLLVFTVGRDSVAPISFNPLIPIEGVDPQTHIKLTVAILAQSFFLGEGVIYVLTVCLSELYEEFGVYRGTPARYPTFRDLLNKIRHYPVKSGRETLWISSALRSIHSLCFGPMDTVVNAQSNSSLKDLVYKAVVFEMDALTTADKTFFAEAVMLWLYQYYQARQTREHLQHVLILEESQNLAPRTRESVSSRDLLDVLASQCREYGIGLVFIAQMPSMISRSALANIHTFIASGVKEKTDASTLQSAMLLDLDQMNALGQLPLGTSVVRIHRPGITEAFMMRAPRVPLTKGTISDDLVHRASAQFIRSAEPPAEAAQVAGQPTLTKSELALLKDIAVAPKSGIVARYTRLHLSGRQGDKVKRSLMDLGYIEETGSLIPGTRRKVLRLTEKGITALKSARSES